MDLPPRATASLKEQSDFFDAHPDCITPEYLNNFYINMPGSPQRTFIRSTKTTREINAARPIPGVAEPPMPANSDIYLDQTAAQFFATLDDAVAAAGLDLTLLSQEVLHVCGIRWGITEVLALNEKLIPVYKEMRNRGYTHYDLIG